MRFLVWLNEQEQGPFDEETIQQMVSEGRVTQDTLLRLEGEDLDWTPVKELFSPELFSKSEIRTGVMASAGGRPVANDGAPIPNGDIDDGARVELRLQSGATIRIKALRLYDEIALAEINSKRAEAIKKLQGISTGLGTIGSVGWVLASSVVIGAVEGVMSADAAAVGNDLLSQVIRMEQKLRERGVFISVGKIENIETPIPGLWRTPYKRQRKVEVGATFLGAKKYESREVWSAFIHSGEDFVMVQTEDGSVCSIRWGTVESYAIG